MRGQKLCSFLGIKAVSLTGRAGAVLKITASNPHRWLPPPLTHEDDHYMPGAIRIAPRRQWGTEQT